MVSQLTRLEGAMSDGLLTRLPPLHLVVFEPHDWPNYIPYRLHVGTFHDPSDGADNLPVWAYLRVNTKGRTPVTMELSSHVDLGGDDEMNWELYYGNIRHDDVDCDDPVHLCAPFDLERSKSELLALVKYYFQLAANEGLFRDRIITFSESFGRTLRAICRRVQRSAARDANYRRPSLSEFPKRPMYYASESGASDTETDDDVSSPSTDSLSSFEDACETSSQHLHVLPEPKARRLRSYKSHNAAQHKYNQESSLATDFNNIWDKGGIVPPHKLKTEFSEASEPSSPQVSTSSRPVHCRKTPNIEDLLERNELLSSEIDILRVELAAKEAKKRKLDLELYGYFRRKRMKSIDGRGLQA